MNDELELRSLRDLKAECPGARSPLEDAERAVRHVAFMDRVARAHRRRARVVPSLLGLAAAVALGLGASRFEKLARSPEPKSPAASRSVAAVATPNRVTPLSGSLRIGGNSAGERELSASSALLPGEHVSLGPKARAVVQLANGALATLTDSGSLTLEGSREEQALRLTSGRVELSVPPLRPHSLAVITLNARVTVVGTQFSVTVEPASEGQTRTCVNVNEGRVSVATASSNVLLTAGAQWSSDGLACAAATVQGSASAAPTPSARPRAQPTSARAAASALPQKVSSDSASHNASLLAEQNRLFAGALRARQEGDVARARALWKALVERFPDAALAPQARRELQKLDQKGGALP